MMRQDRHQWASSLDKFCMLTGALLPIGIIIGNVAFEAVIALVDIAWIIRWVLLKETPFRKKIILHPLILPWILWFGTIIVSLLIHGQGIVGWAHDAVYIRYLFFVAALIDVSDRLPVQKYLIIGLGAGAAWAAINILVRVHTGIRSIRPPPASVCEQTERERPHRGAVRVCRPIFSRMGSFG